MALDYLRIFNTTYPKIRVGTKNDGGYIIADTLEYDVLISCGISDDVTFEKNFLNKYNMLKGYAFDGTINQLPEVVPNLTFIKKNIGTLDTPSTTNLIDIMQPYNNIFLKMDIETFEFRWLEQLPEDIMKKIKQIVIEFHFPFTEPGFTHLDRPLPISNKLNVLQKIINTHTLIHLHGNNCCGTTIYKNITVPNVFECTYIRNDVHNFNGFNTISIPHPLDSPNIGGPDISLKGYPFTV